MTFGVSLLHPCPWTTDTTPYLYPCREGSRFPWTVSLSRVDHRDVSGRYGEGHVKQVSNKPVENTPTTTPVGLETTALFVVRVFKCHCTDPGVSRSR